MKITKIETFRACLPTRRVHTWAAGDAANGAPHRAERPAHSRPGSLGHALRTAS